MTLKQCYEQFKGSYDDVVSRFGGEKMVGKFVCKFLEDKSFSDIAKAIRKGDCQAAFIAAHTLKGICQNLSMDKLAGSSSALCEELRGGNMKVEELLKTVSEDYKVTVEAITQYKKENKL
jgi:HPt (histidine-containing phosphotransfer) domain-containing protein